MRMALIDVYPKAVSSDINFKHPAAALLTECRLSRELVVITTHELSRK